MMAGLPKSASLLLISLGVALSMSLLGMAQEIQTDSNVLQPVFDLIDANANANLTDQDSLKETFENAVTLGLLTPEEALAMLGLVQWGTLEEADALANASAAIQTILADLSSDTPPDDPLAALTQLLNVLATPAGTLNAIGKAGASEEVLDQVSGLVADGVPPGILVRIIKEGLRNGLSMEEIIAQLDALAAAMAESEDVSWGQIANDVTEKGESKHRDQEQNANIGGNEEPEQEKNEHGNGNGNRNEEQEQEENEHGNNNGRKDDNPGKGQGKDKDKS